MKRAILLAIVAMVAVGLGTGFAATLNVGSHHLWAGTQSLVKNLCTVNGGTDTFVDQNSTSATNGAASTLDVLADTGVQKWAFVQFSLTSCSLPATAGADSAQLRLFLSNPPKSSFTLTLSRVTSAWSNTLTWTSAQSVTVAGTTATAASGTASGVWVSFPVTADVDSMLKGGTNDGWRITASGTTQNATKDLIQFASTDSGSNVPQLVINYEK